MEHLMGFQLLSFYTYYLMNSYSSLNVQLKCYLIFKAFHDIINTLDCLSNHSIIVSNFIIIYSSIDFQCLELDFKKL